MAYNNQGIEDLQTIGIRGDAGQVTNQFVFAGSDNTYTGSETAINNEFLRKDITWEKTGIHSKFSVNLSSIDAVGSYIRSGIAAGSNTEDRIQFANSLPIGLKTSGFSMDVIGEIRIRRPE